MRLIIAAVLSIFLGMYYLLRGEKGRMEFRSAISHFTSTAETKYFLYAGIISAIMLVFMLLTGLMTFGEILEIEQREIALCPACM